MSSGEQGHMPDIDPEGATAKEQETQALFLAFLDELTELSIRHRVVISSEGSRDVFSLRMMPAQLMGLRYVPLWGAPCYPLDVVFEATEPHLIDFDRVIEHGSYDKEGLPPLDRSLAADLDRYEEGVHFEDIQIRQLGYEYLVRHDFDE